MVCAVVLRMNNLGLDPTFHNFSTSLVLESLMKKIFLHKQSIPPLHVAILRLGIKNLAWKENN